MELIVLHKCMADSEHDPEKHELEPDPGGYRFSEKIMLEQKQSDGSDSVKPDQTLAIVPPPRLLFDGDFGIADRGHAEQQRTAEPADDGAERHEAKEHQHSAVSFKA